MIRYGEYFFSELAAELGIGRLTLYRIAKFYESYPQIVSIWKYLTWSHIRLLLKIENLVKRRQIEKKIVAEKLTVKQLEYVLQEDDCLSSGKAKGASLVSQCGQPFVYRLKQLENREGLFIDYGFRIYREWDLPGKGCKPDCLVRTSREKKRYRYNIIEENDLNLLYTYQAEVTKVIDGDTIWLNIDLGFSTIISQKVRLRGINAADPGTISGGKVKQFVTRRLEKCKFVLIRTYWQDKFARYLVDLFYNPKTRKLSEIQKTGVYLNQELLNKGLAVRY